MSGDVSIYESLVRVMDDVPEIKKGDRNNFHNFMFRGVERVVNHVGPAFRKHRVLMLPVNVEHSSRDVLTDKGKTAREVTVIVTYTFTGPAGDSLTVKVPGEASDLSGSATSKAMSVAQRIALLQAFTIATQQVDPEASAMTRGADPMLELKKQIKAEADSREWDMARLAQDFSEWSMGEDISDATLDQLQEYYKTLRPAKRVRRAQAGEPA